MIARKAAGAGLALALALGPGPAAAAAEPELLNLARLSIARVSASSVTGGRPLDDALYGVLNLFDRGRNVVNDLPYPYWVSGDPPHWVRIRFEKPVTVHQVLVETGEDAAPITVEVELRGGSGTVLRASGPIALVRDRTVYEPPRPARGVRDVFLAFTGPDMVRVHEVQVQGRVPRRTPVVETLPIIDGELAAAVARETDRRERDRKARLHRLVETELEIMRRHLGDLGMRQDSRRRAEAWLSLNRAADRISRVLEELRQVLGPTGEVVRVEEPAAEQRLATEAGSYGVDVEVCPATGTWSAGDHGYRQYLALWPDGPDADEAWWMAELRNGPRCAVSPDVEPSVEEYRRLIDEYGRFVERFPRSRFAGEANGRVRRYERELAGMRP